MKKIQNKINEDNLSKNEHHSFNQKIIPKINLDNKLLFLPKINNTKCITDREGLNIIKSSFEGIKPKRFTKMRNKIKLKETNIGLKIKYLSYNQRKTKDNLFYLLKKIKTNGISIKNQRNLINDELFENDSSNLKNLIILNKYFKDINNNNHTIQTNLKKYQNFSNIHKKINNISINEPKTSLNNTNNYFIKRN